MPSWQHDLDPEDTDAEGQAAHKKLTELKSTITDALFRKARCVLLLL